MKKLQLTKETLGTLSLDEQNLLRGVNGGMAPKVACPDSQSTGKGCGGSVSISIIGECSAVYCFPSTDCSIRGC